MEHMRKLSDAIDYLVANYHEQPALEMLAARYGYEATYFQKLFQDHVGLSPKKFISFLTARTARDLLLNGSTTLDAAYEAGLSGTGRLHDLFVSVEAASPGEIKARGAGLTIRYGHAPTLLGELMVAETDKGICWLGFQIDESREQSLARMKKIWTRANFVEDDAVAVRIAGQILAVWSGAFDDKLRLHLHGTNFQVQVWQALLKIPAGHTVSYQAIANSIGNGKACRAVGSAIGANPIAFLIPCHRVIQQSGVIENYSWGSSRKKAILSFESPALKTAL